MTAKELHDELAAMKKNDLLHLIEKLMAEDVIDIAGIAICHTRALEGKLAAKEDIINAADNCIFESVFTDSLGKPADAQAMMRKLNWLEKVGTHNMDGIYKYLKNENKVC